jgi:hypothetical protein
MKNNKYILLPALFHQHLFYLKQSRRSHAPQDKANAELLLPEQRLYAVPCTRASQKSTPYEGSLTGRHGRPRLNLWCVRFARSRPRSRPEFKLERYDDIITDNLISTEYVHLPITGIFRRGRCSHLSFEPSRPPLAEAVSDLLSQGHLLQYLARPYLDRRRMVTCTMAWSLRGNRIASAKTRQKQQVKPALLPTENISRGGAETPRDQRIEDLDTLVITIVHLCSALPT